MRQHHSLTPHFIAPQRNPLLHFEDSHLRASSTLRTRPSPRPVPRCAGWPPVPCSPGRHLHVIFRLHRFSTSPFIPVFFIDWARTWCRVEAKNNDCCQPTWVQDLELTSIDFVAWASPGEPAWCLPACPPRCPGLVQECTALRWDTPKGG